MSRPRRLVVRLLALVALIAGMSSFVGAAPASAAELQSAAWWSRTTTTNPLSEVPAPLPVPAPTTPDTMPSPAIPQDQLVVEGTPEGAVALAAIHWELRDGEANPSLELPIGPGSTITPQSVVLACRAAAAWSPPETRPGRWEAKPVTDSRRCINGVIAEDLSTIGFGLQPLINGTSLDITLVPGRVAEAPEGADGSTFRWTFPDPGPDALTVIDSGFDQGAGPVVVTLPPLPTPTTAAAASSGGPTPVVASPTPPPTFSAPTGDSSLAASPALEPADLGETVPRVPELASFPTPADASRPLVGVVLLLLALAAAAWSYLSPASPDAAMIGLGRFRRPLPGTGPIPAGAAATPPTGGLSRFAKPRTEPPVPIA